MTVLEQDRVAPPEASSPGRDTPAPAPGTTVRRVVSVVLLMAGALLFGANAAAIWGTGLGLLGWQSFL